MGSLIAAFVWLDVLMVLFTVTGVWFPTQGSHVFPNLNITRKDVRALLLWYYLHLKQIKYNVYCRTNQIQCLL